MEQQSETKKRPRIVASRACDSCRTGKRRCDGKCPCSYCEAVGKVCAFTAPDKRRKGERDLPGQPVLDVPVFAPPQPPTFGSIGGGVGGSSMLGGGMNGSMNGGMVDGSGMGGLSGSMDPQLHYYGVRSTPPAVPAGNDEATLVMLAKAMANEHDTSFALDTGTSQDASDPSSFLTRLHKHLTIAFSLRSFPRGGAPEGEDPLLETPTFYTPSREESHEFLKCYFEHASVTYRYLDRAHIERLVNEFYDGKILPSERMDDTCLLYMAMAIGCLWSPSWNGSSPELRTVQALNLYAQARKQLARSPELPPRLVRVQAHLANAQLQLGLARFQSAWLTLGTAARTAQLLRLHQCIPTSVDGNVTHEEEMTRRVFWSSFMMDRYLSVVLGYPALYDERDVTQHLPSVSQPTEQVSAEEARTSVGSVAHIKLAKIMGRIARRLHTTQNMSPEVRNVIVHEIELEIAVWEQETPDFFKPSRGGASHKDGFSEVLPFFQRQQQAVHSAYFFLKLFLYRPYLLDSFLTRLPSSTPPAHVVATEPPREVRLCIDAAVGIAEVACTIQNKTTALGTFWNTSFFTFTALSVLLVYLMVHENASDRQVLETIIERAMRGHERLTGSTMLEREQIVRESKRIADVIRQRSGPHAPEPLMFPQFSSRQSTPPASWSNTAIDFDAMWSDLQALVQNDADASTWVFPSLE